MTDPARPTDAEIAEWRRLADAASAGPWQSRGGCIYGGDGYQVADASNHKGARYELADAAFITAARTAVPALIDALAAERDKNSVLGSAFGKADDGDWKLLYVSIANSSHGVFWTKIFDEVRAVTVSPQVTRVKVCTYPDCGCAVTFPEGYKLNVATECPAYWD